MRLALPADLEAYFQRKARAFGGATGELPGYWGMP
jgi:hypothetical protein